MIGGSKKCKAGIKILSVCRIFKKYSENKEIGFCCIIALALSLPPIFVALYVFLPTVYIELIGFFLPDEQYRVFVRIGGKDYKIGIFG
ncbi:MAG: hypothetical protein J5858_10000 [Lentisphaeria bacterium]|nr:hypothetical protein [Lentisphaeria bacterium]